MKITKYLRKTDEFSDVFWSIEAEGILSNVHFGKFGTKGKVESKIFESIKACEEEAKFLIDERINMGYYESPDVVLIPAALQGKSIKKINLIEEMEKDLKTLLITKNKHSIISFIDKYAKGNTTELRKLIKTERKYWLEYVDLSADSLFRFGQTKYGYRADDLQREILMFLTIAICDLKFVNSLWDIYSAFQGILKNVMLKNLLIKTKPVWIEEFLLNQIKRNTWAVMPYQALRYLEKEGLIAFNPELYALNLANQREDRSTSNTRKLLNEFLDDELALLRDVPLLFEYETVINNNNFYEQNSDKVQVEYKLWHEGILLFVNEHKISRAEVITNSLSTQSKEWNNGTKTFFKKLLESIHITDTEIINNQRTIFPFLQQTHTPIVNFGLDMLKSVILHKDFLIDEFMEWVGPVFYRDDCKTGIKRLIPHLEKIAKSKPQLAPQISEMLSDGFVIQDMDLQERISKSINKIGDFNDVKLRAKINDYQPLMLGNSKLLMDKFVMTELEEKIETVDYNFKTSNNKKLIRPIKLPQTWNELLFQFGNFILCEEMFEGEILLNSLVTKRNLFPVDFRDQVTSYLKQLENHYYEIESHEILKKYFISKIRNFNSPGTIRKSSYHKIKTTDVIIELLKVADSKIISGSSLPLLCLPTHYPYWIEPKELILRLLAYEKANEPVNPTDLSVAISRMPRENIEELKPLLFKLDFEKKALLEFCLGLNKEMTFTEQSLFDRIKSFIKIQNISEDKLALWAMAATTFYPDENFEKLNETNLNYIPFFGKPYLSPLVFSIKKNEWKDYRTQKMMANQWREMTISNPNYKKVPLPFIYGLDVFNFGDDYWSYAFYDKGSVYYWESLMPQNIEALANKILIANCKLAAASKNSMFGFLDVVLRSEFKLRYYGMNLFACCFFMDNKEIRIKAAEVLHMGMSQELLDINALGQSCANLINNEYGVFTRFIESIITVKDASILHNTALKMLVEVIFSNLDKKEKTPVNFKKIMECYYDLITKLDKSPSPNTKEFLTFYKDHSSFKKLISQILTPN